MISAADLTFRSPVPRWFPWFAATTALVFLPDFGVAQAHPNPATPDKILRIQSLEPRTGPPGTEVTLYSENLPFQGRVVLGVGAIGAGFEELAEVPQGALGEVGGTVHVPEHATWDRPLVFLTLNGNFAPTAMSDPFHVTDARGLVHREGEVTDEGRGCASMRDSDGYFYTLVGETGELTPGQSIAVEGRFTGTDECSQGETIRVVRVLEPEPSER